MYPILQKIIEIHDNGVVFVENRRGQKYPVTPQNKDLLGKIKVGDLGTVVKSSTSNEWFLIDYMGGKCGV